jgi:hypothetical protein
MRFSIFCTSLPFALVCFLLSATAIAQGSGDVGFGTIQSFKPALLPSLNDTTYKPIVSVGTWFQSSDYLILGAGLQIGIRKRWSPFLSTDFLITSLYQSNDLIGMGGLGDLFGMINLKLSKKTTLSVGTKMPLSNGDLRYNGYSMPMDYQPSLGTYDLIAGITRQFAGFDFAFAYQKSLNSNENTYYEISKSTGFYRSPELMARFSYPLNYSKNVRVTPGIQPVYHLSNDKKLDENSNWIQLNNSKGLCVNAQLFIESKLSTHHSFQTTISGTPYKQMRHRPDGLYKIIYVLFEYQYSF